MKNKNHIDYLGNQLFTYNEKLEEVIRKSMDIHEYYESSTDLYNFQPSIFFIQNFKSLSTNRRKFHN